MSQSDERPIRVSTWMSRRELAGRHIPRARREPAPAYPALSAPIEAHKVWLQNRLAFSTLNFPDS